MSKTKIRVGILCGGKSTEHEISLMSARNVIHALDKNKYEVIVIRIDKKGKWFHHNNPYLKFSDAFLRDSKGNFLEQGANDTKHPIVISQVSSQLSLDIIFPVLHGSYGEDGTMQGLLTLLNIPFVGADVLGSALGMDKDVMKRLLHEAKIPIVKRIVYLWYQKDKISFEICKKRLGLSFFVKPANLGSSVGITKVHNSLEFTKAIKEAFLYDTKILIEEAIEGREIECAVLGNEYLTVSLPGEITPHDEFYSYKAKYLDPYGARLEAPAHLDRGTIRKIQHLALQAVRTLCIEGMARVDFLLRNDGKIFVNEVNTIPGFTAISMYPKMWEASGWSYSQLLDKLIQLAIERYQRDNALKSTITL